MKRILMTVLALSFYVNAEIPTNANDVKPLLPGMMIPEINVKDQDGNKVHIIADQIEKPFVLTFYRGGWCPYCNSQLAGLRKAEKQLIDLGFDVYFISPDLPEKLVSTLKDEDLQKKINYKLLSDSKMKVSVDFGIAFKVDDETVEKYKKWNIDLEKASGETHHLLPAPSIFVVGTNGVIQFQYTNPDYKVRLDPSVLIAVAKSYKKHSKMKK